MKKIENNSCIFCESTKIKFLKNVYQPYNGIDYELYHCLNCDLQFFLPNVFIDIYNTEIYQNWHEGFENFHPHTIEIGKSITELNIDLTNKKILEIGAGDGINYKMLNEKFDVKPENYHVIELDKYSIEVCKKRGLFNIHNIPFPIEDSKTIPIKFDIIILAEVLEHQTEPKLFLDSVDSLLKKDGYLMITVPSRDRLVLEIFTKYKHECAPNHFLRFNEKFFLINFKKYEKLKIYSYKNKPLLFKIGRAHV